MNRKITVLTGTRAEYGLLRSPMESIKAHDCLSLSVIATGMHLSPRYGNTVDEIRNDGFTVDREVSMLVEGDTGVAMAKSLGLGTTSLADAFMSLDPDVVLLLGDRDEALAGALAAAHMNIPVAHIHGGDAMHGAIIDDSIRHAITKFAHIHFPASELSASRIRKLGEEPERITVCGAPGIDDVLSNDFMTPETIREQYRLSGNKPLIVMLQHPVTTQPEQAGKQVEQTLNAIDHFDAHVVIIYPNSDAGSDRIIDEIESRELGPDKHAFRSLPRHEYLGLLAGADVMVGNSSSGILEAPSFGLPAVDIGPRQEGRERGDNTISVTHDTEAIADAIERSLFDEAFKKQAADGDNLYDYGGAGTRISERLAEIEITEDLLRKRLTY